MNRIFKSYLYKQIFNINISCMSHPVKADEDSINIKYVYGRASYFT